VFIIDDAKLLSLRARLHDQGFPIVAMRLGGYLAQRR